jgi:acyl-coenzyme A thioesterase PaaI-like protein
MPSLDWFKNLPFVRRLIIDDSIHKPEPGWTPVAGIADITGHPPRFVSADQEQDRIKIRFFKLQSDGSLRGKVWFGPLCEGPPGSAHGGSVAAVLDEAMGQSSWIAGYPVVAAKIEVNFRLPVPLGSLLWLEASITEVQGRKVFIIGKLRTPDGKVLADSSGLFVILNEDQQLKVIKKVKRPLT